ncbi:MULTISPECIES: hypothetical protein [Myroides]|uniref:Lipoprotein n=1 Tax=Myroides albus TaxID=2562892 RepID=A0A6I3LBF3_9FLAO|nr:MULTISPECIES: hypothetical protein [Myroides]MTG96789.1 hypothetical protein [Myroides albus]MVX36163.1 hypothetical protein [Myroides sp. LoEW2-1]UVD80798.1 hypothetical protein NWE55_06030 [Myroides albus]
MKYLYLITLTLLIFSCGKKQQPFQEFQNSTTEEVVQEIPAIEEIDQTTDNQHPDYPKQIDIDFDKHKDILDMILLLPDTVFTTWGWDIAERQSWYNEIKKNNYYIDDDPLYFNQSYFEPHTAGFSIIDGYWTITIYRATDQSIYIVTDDVVGDSNSIHILEVKENEIVNSYTQEEVFGNFENLVTLPNINSDCLDKIQGAELSIYDVNLDDKQIIEFESSWYHTKDEYQYCLKGNTIQYRFNPDTKQFDIQKIYWKPKPKY